MTFILLIVNASWALANEVHLVELQWVICEPNEMTFFQKLNVQPLSPTVRQVYYSETKEKDLYSRGAIARTRLSKKKTKTAAKIKGYTEAGIPWDFLAGSDFKCEMDSYLEHESIACSLFSENADENKNLTPKQMQFLQMETGFQNWQQVRLWGPVQSSEWDWVEKSINENLVVEVVQGPQTFFSLEMSARVPVEKKSESFLKLDSWLRSHGILLCPDQSGKTAKLLEALIGQPR